MSWEPIKISEKEIAQAKRMWRKKARFFVDESLGREATEFLRELGWNVKDVFEVGLDGNSDEDVIAYAFRENRILLSHDEDFLNDQRFPFNRNPGVVILPGGSGDVNALVLALLDLTTIVAPYAGLYYGAKMKINSDLVFSIRSRDHLGVIKTDRYKYGGHGPAYVWTEA
jgi:predicted nuclease of predicted toxin-antitoxin system